MEIWKDIPNWEGKYQVSNLGRVKSFYGRGRILKQQFNRQRGYYSVSLYSKEKTRRAPVHVIVAEAFLSHKPNGKQDIIVDHINRDKSNNTVENLQLITQRENCSKDKDFVGATFHKDSGKYQASIRVDGKRIYLGHHKTIEEAAEAYQKKLKELSHD